MIQKGKRIVFKEWGFIGGYAFGVISLVSTYFQ